MAVTRISFLAFYFGFIDQPEGSFGYIFAVGSEIVLCIPNLAAICEIGCILDAWAISRSDKCIFVYLGCTKNRDFLVRKSDF
jgi:hypothetical protein